MLIWTCDRCGSQLEIEKGAFVFCTCTPRQGMLRKPSNPTSRQRAHWSELHGYNPVVWDEAAAREWFADWQRRIPNIACDCRRHWRELVAEMPPDFSSREAFFAWTVEAHNAVNSRLGKPLVTLEEAYRLHSPASRVE